ncbi:hypothetical protein [Streptomyces sp. NPDC001930]|uniref:hypothetical protein n=1 Tax=Streptomyces sp. NPDC001930 TaxID=3364625 RepID=UPI0036871445
MNLTLGLGREASGRFDSTMDRYARRRRETWFAHEMGAESSHFSARAEFRR